MLKHCHDILLVDDNPIDAEIFSNFLRREGACDYDITLADSGSTALEAARRRPFDCIVLDYNLPDMDGSELLSELIPDPADVDQPVVVLTGVGNEAVAVEMMKLGSQDYIPKCDVTQASLVQAVHNAVEKVSLRRELKRQKEALENAREEQLALKDRFLSHVSHELRTPLTAIDQFLSLVLDGIGGEISETQREYLEIAARNTRQLTKMIADLMDAVRAQSEKLRIEVRPLDLLGLLEEILPPHVASASANGITLRSEVDTGLPRVLADEVRTQQVVGNLVENALKFTPECGEIELRATLAPEDEGFVRISVRDTGCGMSSEAAAQIFERLFQAGGEQRSSREGLGLGLSICQQLVTRQGGRIWVESKLDAGSTFHFTLPVFSVRELLRPALFEGGKLRESVSMISVRARSADASLLSETEARKLYHALGSLVYYPQMDVLLPRRLGGEESGPFYVVAAADALGCEAMQKRVKRYLSSRDSSFERLDIQVDGETLEVGSAGNADSDALERIVQRIETIILNKKE